MKAVLKIKTVVLFLFIVCNGQNTQAQQPFSGLDSMDIVFIESFKDSVDIQSFGNIFQIAYADIHNGNNDRGNRIINFILSHKVGS